MPKGYSNRKLRATAAVNVLLVSLGVQPAIAQEAFFTGLGYLYPGINSGPHYAYGISADGSTVVGEGRSINGSEAFRWTAPTGMVGLGDLPGGEFRSSASDVSTDGSVVVGWGTTSEGQVAIRWTEAGGMESLGRSPGGGWSRAAGVSADGSVVVGTAVDSNGREQAFRWTRATGIVGLGYLDPSEPTSFARDVSADGSVVVGYSPASPPLMEAFRWTEQTGMVRIGGRRDSLAMAVSDDGRVIVGTRYVAGAEAFRWTEWSGQLVGIGTLPGAVGSGAGGVSGDGSVIIGGSGGPSIPEPAYIWDCPGGMHSIKDLLVNTFGLTTPRDWRRFSVNDVSADGRTVVGTGIPPVGNEQPWLAFIPELPPERPCRGDLTGDGIVGLDDLGILLASFGSGSAGDLTCDGQTDLSDLGILLAHFGERCP